VNTVMKFRVPKSWEILKKLHNWQLLKKGQSPLSSLVTTLHRLQYHLYKATRIYFQPTSGIHTPVGNSNILTQGVFPVRLPTQAIVYTDSCRRCTFVENSIETPFPF
jgi:hypothetical protein